jgi:hypothetical protein
MDSCDEHRNDGIKIDADLQHRRFAGSKFAIVIPVLVTGIHASPST